MYKHYQPNPCGRNVGDCAVRAISAALDMSWEEAFDILTEFARNMCDMPSADQVWGAVLRSKGFIRIAIPAYYPRTYTISNFCRDYKKGIYILATGGHVATVIDGDLYDSWDSSQEMPVYYWTNELL